MRQESPGFSRGEEVKVHTKQKIRPLSLLALSPEEGDGILFSIDKSTMAFR